MSNLKKLIVILGPTASGKTDLAIKLAKKFNGEVVSADSRQIYKEMDIGTAKPLQIPKSKCQIPKYKGIPHYMIDVVYPDEEFNVAIYKRMAIKTIKDIQRRGKLPFLVGGTGLYIQAVVDNIEFPKVPAKKRLRKKLEKKTERELFKVYKKLDPIGANFIEKENKRRLIRAIEVCKVTGKSFWKQRKKGKPLFDVLEIGLQPALHPPAPPPKNGSFSPEYIEKIKKRVEKMFKLGLEKEVKNLVEKYGFEIPSMQTIGYQEWKDYYPPATLQSPPTLPKKETQKIKEKIKLHTFQFAKRQMTWFRRDKRIHWIRDYQEAEKLIKKFLL